MSLKLFAFALLLGAIGCWALVRFSKPRREETLSERWRKAQEARDNRQGVDLPRWKFPHERDAPRVSER